MLTPQQLRQRYLNFFTDKIRQHVAVPSAPIVPENDPTTLFTGSGMQPMVPYLLGQKHPLGTRLTDIQRCFRAEDIEEVGDNRHSTFFEMLGNWSLGDYLKNDQLTWFFEFLVEVLGFDPRKLYITIFAGDQNSVLTDHGKKTQLTADEEAVSIWQKLFKQYGIEAKTLANSESQGMKDGRIFYYQSNWWSRAGEPSKMPTGEPGGPDSEVFFDFGADLKLHEKSKFKNQPCHVNCDCGRFLEIGNSVFMQFQKTDQGFEVLTQKNIDFGGGLERILAAMQNEVDMFKTQAYQPIIEIVEKMAKLNYDRASEQEKISFRVIADHLRAAVILAMDGVYPSNKEQGYVARRLIRRTIRYAKLIGIEGNFIDQVTPVVIKMFKDFYFADRQETDLQKVKEILVTEEKKFQQSLIKGLKEFEKIFQFSEKNNIPQQTAKRILTGDLAFKLFESYGFPLELSIEEARNQSVKVELDIKNQFEKVKLAHQEKSRTASAGMFKGGLEDQSVINTKYHTATHLLHAALRKILGSAIQQKGSNINAERLRFDFSFNRPLTSAEIKKIEQQINDWILADLPVHKQMMDKKEAVKSGALAFFIDRYPEQVTVYTIGKDLDHGFISKELCGGPHVKKTAEIGKIKIIKEKSAAAGVRRIYLVVEK